MKLRSVLECGDKRNATTWPAFLAALLLTAAGAHAQSLTVDWFTFAGGGGASTGGVLALSGTIGQPAPTIQPLTAGNLSLTGGFWSLFAVQTPGAPSLTIRLMTANTVRISWPSPSPGFTLQQNADLNITTWTSVPQMVTDDGTNRFIIVYPPAGNRFYRLFKP